APGLAPAWMEGCVYGWVDPATAAALGVEPEYRYLKITTKEGKLDEASIRAAAAGLTAKLRDAGIEVAHVEVPKPGQHPHATQMMTLLYLLETFGLLALVLSGVLVATMISALMARQTRQIGIMKAVGGSSRQIAAMYFGLVLALGALAACIALPLATFLARAYTEFAARMLNFSIFDDSIPAYYYLAELAVALAVPAAAAGYSILRGSRITVREALSDPGFAADRADSSPLDRFLGSVAGASRPLLLSLRNVFRRRGRLVLTLATLAAGGAIFMTAMNVQASMTSTAVARFSASRFDFAAVLGEARATAELDRALSGIPGVAAYESWGRATAARLMSDGGTGNSFTLMAFPARSALQEMPAIEGGRWLEEGDTDAIVVNQRVMSANPG
ncbi:MAG: FtsX-like permease family protein, partial [Spirochaetaceae bacterium]|nr:FtsX-like permease family protein [Spirochaetaceae bacterium]